MGVFIKLSDGSEHNVDVNDFTITVLQFKEECEKVISIPASELRVVFRGKIFQDTKTLESYGVKEGSALHIVKNRAHVAPPAETTPPAPQANSVPQVSQSNTPSQAPQVELPNPYSALSGVLGNSSVPNGMGNLMNGNPGLGNLFESEYFRQSLNNPDLIRAVRATNPTLALIPEDQFMALMQPLMENPELRNQAMQIALSNLQAGRNMPMGNAGGFEMPPFPVGGPTVPQSGAPPSFPQNNFSGLGGVPSNVLGSGFSPPPPRGDPRVIYRQQLQEIKDMGFPNEEAILIALEQAQGNVSFAVDRLLGAP